MAARHNILPTFCRFCLWQSEKQFLEQKGCDQGFRIPDSGFQILHSRFWIPGRLLLFWLMNFSCRTNDSWPFCPPQYSISQSGGFQTLRSLAISELYAGWRFLNSTQSGDFRTLRSLETFELIAVLRLPCSSQFWDFRAFRSLEVSVLFAVLRLLNSSQSGDFCALPYGHKREKNREKVQNHPEARGKYGAEQLRMGIKHRKSVKKSKITRKPERNTEPSRRKWT